MTDEAKTAVEQALTDRRLERSTTEVKTGGIDAAVLQYNDSTTPDLIVIESASSGEDLVEKIDSQYQLRHSGTITPWRAASGAMRSR